MDTPTALGLLGVALLIAANGFFVATEFAIVAVRRSRLEQLEAEGKAAARAARDLVEHLDTYIAACQLGITMASLALGWVGEPAIAHLLEPAFEHLIGTFAPALAHGVAIGITFAIITALHIVLGEQVPKLIGLQKPEATTLFVAGPMRFFHAAFRWPVALLNNVGNGVLKLLGLQPGTGHEMVHSVEELRMLVNASQQAGAVEASEARIASRAFAFADLTAGALMTPRTEVVAVPITATLRELVATAAASRHTRLLVYEDSLDNPIGVLHALDILSVAGLLQEAGQSDARFDVRGLARPIMMVPESKAADDLLEQMRSARQFMALVMDEYGGTAGIVTLEDLVEALVGRIDEEPPPGAEPVPASSAALAPDGSAVLDGLMRLGELEELTGLRLDESDHEDADTLGGLVMARLGRIPDVGDEVTLDSRVLRVEQLDGRRVALVRLLPARPSED